MSQYNSPYPGSQPGGGPMPPQASSFGAPAPGSPSNKPNRWLWPAIAALAVIALLLVFGVWFTTRDNSTDVAAPVSETPDSTALSPTTTEPTLSAKPIVTEPTNTVITEPTTTSATTPATTITTPTPTTVAAEPAPTLSTELAPRLHYSVQIRAVEGPYKYGPRVAGTPNDFYVAEGGADTTTVTRFVNGEVVWQSNVGLQAVGGFDIIDNRVVLTTYYDNLEGDNEVVGLDVESGATAWSLPTPYLTGLRVHAGRYYLITSDGFGDTPAEVVEINIVDGSVLNRATGSRIYPVEIGYGSWNETNETVQLLDFDLQPSGGPVAIEPEKYSLPTFDRGEAGWVYLVEGAQDADPPKVIGLSPGGERRFECGFSIAGAADMSWYRVHFVDSATVSAEAYDGIEVFNIDGSTCTSTWNLVAGEDRLIAPDDPNLSILNLPVGEDGQIDRYGGPGEIQRLDWRTGQTIATGNGELFIQSTGLVVTHDDNGIVARMVDSGDERWRIDAAPGSELIVIDAMLGVITQNGESATLDIYSYEGGNE